MGHLLAAAPFEDWVRAHSPVLAVSVVGILALLVVRLVIKTMTRIIVLSVLAALTLFVWVERHNIRTCTQSCTCTVAGFDLDVPACDPDVL